MLGVCQRSEENYSLKARKGYLRIYASKTQAKDCAAFSYLGVRQCSYSMYVSTQMEFELEAEGDAAGLLLFQNQKNHLKWSDKKGKNLSFLCDAGGTREGRGSGRKTDREKKDWKYILKQKIRRRESFWIREKEEYP